MAEIYDVIIIGGGPAGLTAAIYSARAGRRTLLVERGVFGGQIATTDLVENYPGFPDGITGPELGELMRRQAERYGTKVVMANVSLAELAASPKIVRTDAGSFLGRAIILAGGADYRKLGVPGEKELTGKGVSYCATCDGPFFKGQKIAVVGGGDSALTEALFLTKFASEVTVIHRRDQLRGEKVLQERAFANPRIRFLWNTIVLEIVGEGEVQALRLRDIKTGGESTLEVSGIFVSVGLYPNIKFLLDQLPLDGTGRLVVNKLMETAIPGVFACGDVRQDAVGQAITSAGDGATAAIGAEHYLSRQGEVSSEQGRLLVDSS